MTVYRCDKCRLDFERDWSLKCIELETGVEVISREYCEACCEKLLKHIKKFTDL